MRRKNTTRYRFEIFLVLGDVTVWFYRTKLNKLVSANITKDGPSSLNSFAIIQHNMPDTRSKHLPNIWNTTRDLNWKGNFHINKMLFIVKKNKQWEYQIRFKIFGDFVTISSNRCLHIIPLSWAYNHNNYLSMSTFSSSRSNVGWSVGKSNGTDT